MDVLSAIKERRAVKHFDPEHVMTAEEKNQLLSLAALSPTAFNIQHWRFVVVEDLELKEQIREAAWGQAQVTDASMLILMCADKNAWKKSPDRYWVNAPKEVQDYLIPAINNYYEGKERVQQDECMRSCGIAAQTLMLAAKGMGYDSCPMDGFDFDKVAKLINLPEDHVLTMFVAVGKALDPANTRGGQLPLSDIVIKDRF
ncbi:MAG: nitroreductase family protein [Lentisphaeraceae bacterium]|nr:nitroreductase family protein [Lentisphaeraceae bacterium]